MELQDRVDCDPSDNTGEDARGGEGQNTACSHPYRWCLSTTGPQTGKCVTKAEYEEGYDARGTSTRLGFGLEPSRATSITYDIDPDAVTLSVSDVEAALEDSDAELSSGEEITAIFTRNDSDYRTGGYYDSPVFLATENLNFASYLEDGDMGIYYDKFFRYLVTYTLYYPAETVGSPVITDEPLASADYIDIDAAYSDSTINHYDKILQYVDTISSEGSKVEDMTPEVVSEILSVVTSVAEDFFGGRMSEDEAKAFFVSVQNWQAIQDAIDRMKP
tara:strand:- start:4792 stop:5616 length:825 start_codon:yes stop_codon:yes gene_type:complete